MPDIIFKPTVKLLAKTEPYLQDDIDIFGDPYPDWRHTEAEYARAGGHSVDDSSPESSSIIEYAGRGCYRAFARKNPETRKRSDYIANIISQEHYSVLEHVSLVFLFTGISRAASHEIVRHRHFSFSQESQRFVLTSGDEVEELNLVVPPALSTEEQKKLGRVTAKELFKEEPHTTGEINIQDLFLDFQDNLRAYTYFYETLRGAGKKRKQASEAARAVIPNSAETRMVVTGNLRSWMEFISKRISPAADAKLQEIAQQVLAICENVIPDVFSENVRPLWLNNNEQKGPKNDH